MEDNEGEYKGQRRALIVSISQYDKLGALDFCESDGNKIYEVLDQLEYDIPIKNRLIGGRVEFDNLRECIYEFFENPAIRPKDTIIFYFSGHGVLGDDGEHYLSTSEIDPDKPHRRGISFDSLSKARERCNSKTIFTILDCCYSGADKPGSKGSDDKANDAKALLKSKSQNAGEGNCILTACKPMQKAYEYKEQGHSYFTFFLTEALTNRACADNDGNVTAYMVNEYIDERIRSLPAETRPKQTPFLNCSSSGKIILAQHAKPKIKTSDEETKSTIDRLGKLLVEEKIDEFNKLRKEDMPLYLRKWNLSEKSLIGADLREADLTGAKLANTKLSNTNLKGAKLVDADLSSAVLRSADLQRANLFNANLKGANLKAADLKGAYLSKANLTGANLRAADLSGMIDFSGANLTGADLRGADLSGMVDFTEAILCEADFTGCLIDDNSIKWTDANLLNAKGLPPRKLKPEEGIREPVKKIEITPKDNNNDTKKNNLNAKFVGIAKKVAFTLPKKSRQPHNLFGSLNPFKKLTGEESQQEIHNIIIQKEKENIEQSNLIGDKGTEFESLIKQGSGLVENNKFQDALEKFQSAIEIDRSNADAHSKKSFVLIALGEFKAALEAASTALNIDPKNAVALMTSGYAYFAGGQYEKAIEFFNETTEIDPNNIDAWINKGNCYTRIKRKKEAADCFKIANSLKKI